MNTSHLALFLFGTPRLFVDDKPYDYRLKKGKALLAVLAVEEGAKSRDSLATMLWPDFDHVRARTNLRRTLSRLNQTPFSGWIEADSEHIALNPGEDGFIDVREFSRLILGDSIETLRSAIDLYLDDFLSDFYLGDNELFEEWSVIHQEFYRRTALESMHRLVEKYIEQQDYKSAIAVAYRQLELDRLRESAWRQLMKLLALDERRTEAITQYENMKQLLSEELGVPPSNETEVLYASILGGSVQTATKIHGYQIKEKIGEGSIGVVYRAFQPTVERVVAIKEIKPKYANKPEFIRRFEAEAQLFARLEHPHIVPLYDYWREPDRAYVVMRFFNGGSIKDKLNQGPYTPYDAVKLVQQVASGLALAHRQSIIHRNLKPANILIDEAGDAYLSDFSISLDMGNENDGDQKKPYLSSSYLSPEQLLNDPVSPPTDIYSLGVILYELLSGKHPFAGHPAPVMIEKLLHENLPPLADIPESLDAVIQQMTAKKPADRYQDISAMVEALHSVVGLPVDAPGVSKTSPAKVPNPYMGLRAYSEADAELFFGREKSTKMLIEQLKISRLLCMVGPSGSGKSSLARAGLIPSLRHGAVPGSENWYITEMLPGTHPFEELEAALLRVASSPTELLLDQLKQDSRGLIKAVKRILPQDEGELLVLIDQFEELFTLVDSESLRGLFLNSLEEAVKDPRSRIRIILVLRADFYDRPLLYQSFGELLHSNTSVILPPSKEEMSQVISLPAESVGIEVEEGLLATMIADVQDQPGVFPLLQYTLTELFDCRENNRMSLSSYESIGGVSGSLGKRAEDIYLGLEPANQVLTQQLFLRLVNISETTEYTRRRTLRSELMSVKLDDETRSSDVVNQIINLFGQYRLLTFDYQVGTREPTVEVAHEALLSEWPRLKTWLAESREDLYQQRRLRSLTFEWIMADKSDAYLLRGGRLDQIAGWASSNALALTENEREFLGASEAARTARQVAEERRRNQELETAQRLAEAQSKRAEEQEIAARKLRRRAYYLLGALGVAAFLAVVAVIFGGQASRNAIAAEEQAKLATSRELAMAALNEIDIDPERSALLALQALSTTHTIEAEEALHQAVSNMRVIQRYEGHQAYLNNVAYSIDGTRLATTSGDGSAKIWDVKTGQPLISISSGNAEFISIAFHPSDQIIATGDSAGFAKLWDAKTGQELESFPLSRVISEAGKMIEGSEEEISIVAVSFSPDGEYLAGGNFGGTINIWDINSGDEHLLTTQPQLISLAYHPDGAHLATASGLYPGYVTLLEIPSGEQLYRVEGGNAVSGLAFSPDGNTLATTGFDGNLVIWDSLSGEMIANKAVVGELYSPAFDPDGLRLIVAHPNGTAILLDAATLEEILILRGHTASVNSVAFNPDGEHAATASSDGIAMEWDLGPGSEILTIRGVDGFLRVAYHPDGKQLATTSLNGEVAVWDAENGDLIWRQRGHEEFVGGLSYSTDGSLIASSSDIPPVIIIWDSATGERLETIEDHTDFVNNIAFSPSGLYLASASEDYTVKIWDMEGREVHIFEHPAPAWGLAFHPDGDILTTSPWDDNLASATQAEDADAVGDVTPDQRVVSWDLKTGEQIMNLGTHSAGVRDVVYSPDGDRLAAAAWDGTVTIWNAVTGDRFLSFEAFNHAVFRLAFNPDGSRLATIGGESIKIWDASTGDRLLTFEDHNDLVYGVEYSPDGRYLATASLDGTVRVRALELDELTNLAGNRLTRSWTEEECKNFLHLASCHP
jgi:WD40 repeat protein/DNA-binding SARP family transcriptional activator